MQNWKDVLIDPGSTIIDTVELLNRNASKILLVVDAERRLLGTVTDGDIRRGLIRHCSMNMPVSDVMCKKPTVASISDDKKTILAMMEARELLHMPLVDSDQRVVGLETLQHLLKGRRLNNPVLLLAGGFGKRLQPLTNECPKPLIKVGTKPILHTIIEQFIGAGFHKFFISTHHMAEKVRDYFGNGGEWGVSIEYVHEAKPLGTAGALGLLPKEDLDWPIIVMNGDLLTKINYEHLIDYHNEHDAKATICVREYDFQVPYGVVNIEGNKITSILEKPVQRFFVNAGIYVIEKSIAEEVNGDDYLDMPDLIGRQIHGSGDVITFPLHEYWIDIGRIDELERAKKDFSEIF